MCDDILRRTSIRTEVTDEHLSRRTGWQQFFRCMFVYLLIHVPFFSWFTGHKKTLVQVVYFRFEKWPAIREGCIPFTDRMQICRNTLKNLFDYSWPSHHTISKFSFKWKPQERGKSIDILFLFFLLNKPCYHLSPMTQPNLIPAPPFISIRIMAAFVGQGTWVSPVIPRRFR